MPSKPNVSQLVETARPVVTRLAEEETSAIAAGGVMHGVKASLIESGVLLYLHTAGGGAV